ncbi:NAD-dependent epimerase/dehydratase family protein [Fluviicola chungangensis]|uniref:NAD-dependent epimerase/dehydratase family protein n=1 Tax=Fluviicola chungangensis TaxID=2597671 RepID=A0A556MPX1_9FLAO|nr:NAD-dependent epimerase/dehydratase family protein [Fluviicola chungangensis]TSJ41997.1 NAD-dependent epimerase/dehydratase family protein [Fluviicola chungangensis]
MDFKGKRIFISGGAGVIGTEMVQLLQQQGAHIMVGDLKPIPADFPSTVIYRQGDLNYITQVEVDHFNPEYFIHLAATFERSTETYEHWEENFHHNILLSHHLMTLMRNVPGLKRVVNASSYLIYDKAHYQFKEAQNQPVKLTESHSINPRNLTGLAKLAHEIELDFLALFKSDQFTSISARIYRGYGKNSRDIISRWVRDLLNNEKITVYNPEGFFDYIYAQDTAKGLLKLALCNQTGIVNLGTGRSRQVGDVVRILHAHFPQMNTEYIRKTDELIEASEADTTLLKKYIAWAPERDLENTIPEIIAFEQQRQIAKDITYGNILVSSASRKIGLIQSVKKAANKIHSGIKVIAADASDTCLAKHFTDDFWKIPLISEIDIHAFIKECQNRSIQLIIPSRDGELAFFAENKSLFEQAGIHVMVSNKESIRKCVDKLAFYRENENVQSRIIPTAEHMDSWNNTRFVVKERFGAGSDSIGINLGKEEASVHADQLKFPIFQPFIDGLELSIDAYIDKTGKVKGIIMRKRELVVNGESQVTSTIHNPVMEKEFRAIIDSLKLSGHIILQAIIDSKGEIHVIECNPRFGGASTLSVKAGLDSFYWAYLESCSVSLEAYPFIPTTKTITQVRYPADLYL